MKIRIKLCIISTIVILMLMISAYFYQHSSAFVRDAPEDRNGLWMAALKGFRGSTYYVGSEGDYSYFRAGDIICSRYKAPTAKLHLPSTFPLGKGTPYAVTIKMVPKYP